MRHKRRYLGPDLGHGVSVPQRGGVWRLVHGVKVHGDAKGHTDLIGAGVAPTDGPRGVVHLVGNALFGHGLR